MTLWEQKNLEVTVTKFQYSRRFQGKSTALAVNSYFLQFFLIGALKNEKMKLTKLGVKWKSQNSPPPKFRKVPTNLFLTTLWKNTKEGWFILWKLSISNQLQLAQSCAFWLLKRPSWFKWQKATIKFDQHFIQCWVKYSIFPKLMDWRFLISIRKSYSRWSRLL